ncbi:MAG: PEGA domain-containing protein, partial [Bacteroidales bacterium]
TTINEDFSSHLSIDINSSPSGASVYFDDKYEGKTPLKLNTSIGKHKFRLSLKPDYLDKEQEIEVSQQNKYFILALSHDPKSKRKKDELAEKIYAKDKNGYTIEEGILVKGVYQVCYVNGGPALFTPPLLIKMTSYGKNGITGSNAFINIAILGRFMITPAIVTYDLCSVGVGFLGVSSNHKNRLKIEIGGGLNIQFPIKTIDYNGEEIVRKRKIQLIETSSSDIGDIINGYSLVPFDASISYERYIGGKAFMCFTAGCLWGPAMNWYKASEVEAYNTYGASVPSPLFAGDLPASPFIEDFQPYFGLGFRF